MEYHQAILHLTDNMTMNVNVFHSLWDETYYCITDETNKHLYAADEHVLFTRLYMDRGSVIVIVSKDNHIFSFDGRVNNSCSINYINIHKRI